MVRVGDVADNRECLTPMGGDLIGHSGQPVAAACGHHHGASLPGKGMGDDDAEAGGGARNDGGLPIQTQ